MIKRLMNKAELYLGPNEKSDVMFYEIYIINS